MNTLTQDQLAQDQTNPRQESEAGLNPAASAGQSPGRASVSTQYGQRDPRRKSAFVAGLLSLIPGLGQVYVGYYRQGFINIVVFGSVFTLVSSGFGAITPFAIVFMVFFEFYNIIDASRRATFYNLALDGVETIELPDALTNSSLPFEGSYLIGGALLLFGAIALSNTLFGLSLAWLEQFWPVFPMILGSYLVYQAFRDGQSNAVNDEERQEVTEESV